MKTKVPLTFWCLIIATCYKHLYSPGSSSSLLPDYLAVDPLLKSGDVASAISQVDTSAVCSFIMNITKIVCSRGPFVLSVGLLVRRRRYVETIRVGKLFRVCNRVVVITVFSIYLFSYQGSMPLAKEILTLERFKMTITTKNWWLSVNVIRLNIQKLCFKLKWHVQITMQWINMNLVYYNVFYLHSEC